MGQAQASIPELEDGTFSVYINGTVYQGQFSMLWFIFKSEPAVAFVK